MEKRYSHYFDIDEEFYKVVDQHLIESGSVDWKKFLPHETFVRLIETTIKVITREQRLSIWVEGGYGTGKSYAVLTLKKLLEADEEETREYFERYGLSNDLLNKLMGVKNQGKIITVHRYGAQSITNEQDLLFAVQESTMNALRQNGIEPDGSDLKESVLNWLSNPNEANYFDSIIKDEFRAEFGGDGVKDVIEKLKNYTGEQLAVLMGKITRVAQKKKMGFMTLTKENLVSWIKTVIKGYNLKAIVFIWDEFTKFFQNNIGDLTTFQYLAEVSESAPFYFVIVTHVSEGLFAENDNDRKIIDRFVRPTCLIELPDTMAFRLMAMSMRKVKDETIEKEWKEVAKDLAMRTEEPRKRVLAHLKEQDPKFTDQDMINILPMHPYSALLLKYLSAKFASNQRSMFDFIKNNNGEDVKGFQWFIQHNSPFDDDDKNLLTVDMLWNFFYENGKDQLAKNIRRILDHYEKSGPDLLTEKQRRVLKAVLLMSAVSDTLDNKFDLLLPTPENIKMAFTGLDSLDADEAYKIAQGLVSTEHILYLRTGKNKKEYYVAAIAEVDSSQKAEFEKSIDELKTTKLVQDAGFGNDDTSKNKKLQLVFQPPVAQRFSFNYVGEDSFIRRVRSVRDGDLRPWQIPVVMGFAKTDAEMASVGKAIRDFVKDKEYAGEKIVYVNVKTPLGTQNYDSYKHYMTEYLMYEKNDKNNARIAQESALQILNEEWGDSIARGPFEVYWIDSKENCINEVLDGFENLSRYLAGTIARDVFPCCFEKYTVSGNLYKSGNNVALGVRCALNRECSGPFKNPASPTESVLEGAWSTDIGTRYWEQNPGWHISKLKKSIEEKMIEFFVRDGRISIREIYEVVETAPFGMIPCNLTGFILGFALRDYADDPYSYTDETVSETMNPIRLANMIAEIIKDRITPSKKYKDKYIVAKTEEEQEFQSLTEAIFGVPNCTTVQETRTELRKTINNLEFPLWTLNYIMDDSKYADDEYMQEALRLYTSFLNSREVSDVSICKQIGEISLADHELRANMQELVSRENCQKGMDAYLHEYKEGVLIELVDRVEYKNDKTYLSRIKEKIHESEDALWLWEQRTVNDIINGLISEYRLVDSCNQIFSEKCHSGEETLKNWKKRCESFRVPFAVIRERMPQLAELLDYLTELMSGSIAELLAKTDYCYRFYNCISKYKNDFVAFQKDQRQIFIDVNDIALRDMDEGEAEEIYKAVGKHSAICSLDKNEFATIVTDEIKNFKSTQKKAKLMSLWKEKTKTRTPQDWSNRNKTPILVMIPANERVRAKEAFNCFIGQSPNDSQVDHAISYLSSAGFFEDLNDKEVQDKAFSDDILKDYSPILTDLDKIRDDLYRKFPDVYGWYSNDQVDTEIRKYAEYKYVTETHNDVENIIKSMGDAELKNYLVRLAKDNTLLGIQILKNKR